jgi:hypothetical protein
MSRKIQSCVAPEFAPGREYADLVALVERCVVADIEREKVAPVDPHQLLGWVRSIASVNWSNKPGE